MTTQIDRVKILLRNWVLKRKVGNISIRTDCDGGCTIKLNETKKLSIDKIYILIEDWLNTKQEKDIAINFYKGGISSTNFKETIKLPKQD